MLRTTTLTLCLVLAVVALACSKTETTTNSNTASGSTEKPAAASTPATNVPPAGGDVGVAECDEYIKKYESCTSKVPEMARAQYESAGKQMREQWKKLAENPQTRATLAAACKQATEQQAAAWKMYGCAN